ncbi:MAG: inositol monophosphatase [Rhodobacter sp.]|nr:hypothetical protein [Paracoccaceae bacterium]MCC0077392.1 inositol monophosphatase [Rhodobacter sp.]
MPAHRGPANHDLRTALGGVLEAAAHDILSAPPEVFAKGGDGIDLVTSIDFALQERLVHDLEALLPGSTAVGEEGYAEPAAGSGPVWIVDPLDGTVNFVAGLPAYAISVALLIDGQPVLAAVHDIPHRCTYTALAGDGAFLDGAALTRRTTAARLAVLSSGLLADLASCDPATLGAVLRRFKLRNFGSQALHLCHAAAGHVAMVASREARGWDDLAGALIAREAGLIYGSYLPDPTRRPGDEQYSLCAPADLFDHYALTLAASGRTNTNGA